MNIKSILVPGLATIPVNATMLEARQRMQEKGIRHLPVTDGTRLIGIVSDRDVKLASVLMDGNQQEHIHAHKLVSDFMTSPVIKANINDSVESVVREMLNLRVSSIIIEDKEGRDVGIITTEDLMIVLLDLLDKSHNFFSKFRMHFRR